MLTVVADTNIYISAILFGGKPEKIIKLAAAEEIVLLLSNDILAEITFVLRSKFNWSNEKIEQVDRMLRETSVLVTPTRRLKLIIEDDADNRILECALEGAADMIISGDKKHLLPLGEFKGIRIVDAAGFLAELHNSGAGTPQ